MKKINYFIYITLLVYLGVAIFFWYFNDAIANWAITANPVLATIVNFITNPFYLGSLILVIEVFFRGYKLKRNAINYLRVIFASVLFSLSVDIVSILHTIDINYQIVNDAATSIYFDTVLGKLLIPYLQSLEGTGTFTLYVIIPIIMAILALFIASPNKFLGIVKKEFGQ